MNNNHEKCNQRGSILVVCLGLLFILALMATAFIANINMQREASTNYQRSAVAEITALSGKAHALSLICSGGTKKHYGEGWFTTFHDGGTNSVKDMWRHVGITDITASALEPYLGFPNSSNAKSKWFNFAAYSKDLSAISNNPNASTAEFPIQARYAVGIIDLTGLMPMNYDPAGGTSTTATAQLVGELMNQASTYDSDNISASAFKDSFYYTGCTNGVTGLSASVNLSWDHIRGRVRAKNSPIGHVKNKYIFMTTPFSAAQAVSGTNFNIAFNANTAPKYLLKALYEKADNSATPVNGFDIWYGAFNRQATTLTGSDTVIDNLVNSGTDGLGANVGTLITDAKYFRVVVRGQLYHYLTKKVLAEKNFEFAVYGPGKQILFQKEVSGTRKDP